MGPVLNGLVKLQSVENRMRAAKAKLARSRRTVIFQENQLRNLQNSLLAKQEEIKLTKVQADRLELELKSRDEHIAKYRAALNMAKTNKEYSTILTELNTSKADNSKIETQILDLMRNIEADQAECLEIEEQIEQQKEKLTDVRKESEIQVEKFQAEIDTIQVEWDQTSKGIPAAMLAEFNRIADTYDGEAIAVAGKQNERVEVFSCGGCFMGVPAEMVNQLMTKDDLIRCPNCSRILVVQDSEN